MSTSHGHGHQKSAIERIYTKKWSFLVVFAMVFILMFAVLDAVGFVPNSVDAQSSTADITPVQTVKTSALLVGPVAAINNATESAVTAQGEAPVKISIPKIGLSQTIANPNTTNVESLDQYLLKGAVRYPTSAVLGEQGNVVLFGHSSYLPVVHNQAYKAFDGIQNLKTGDQITVYSSDRAYTYSVTSVEKKSANSDGIALTKNGYTLTLATCNSFGAKSDRFVVTATLVGSYALGN